MKIYHNKRCRKSRETLEILNSKNVDFKIIEYLYNPPSLIEIKQLLKLLNISAIDLIRKEEKLYKEKYKQKKFTEDQWIQIMHSNPILIQRPIVVKDNEAIIGRPPLNVLDLLK
ncbi:MAG: arsenate reductase (glutaredoxin) [Flavobacteriales bacterium]|nr:arsenate reductase (glutaredoxin) [Flavobacteriales bacterium]|tara:strand:- start:8990 stop:9331 length:342 start_codon:yes stop_codon:yes gene_type:complete